jgi:glycosyltransferase involved in cell wall biosynthesis
MKIALIAHSRHPIKQPFEGGLEMVTYALCEQLMARGHIVHLYARGDSDARFDVIPLNAKSNTRLRPDRGNAVPDITKNPELQETLWYSRAMTKIGAGDYDIVHNHSLHYQPILLGNCLDVPFITTIHTPTFTYLKLGALGIAPDNRQTFTMVSESLKKTWEPFIKNAKVVYNGIELKNWKFNPDPSQHLFWYGRICPEKGTHLAIRAAMEMGQQLLLAGPNSNPEYFEKEVEPYLSHPLITYLGHLEQAELQPYLASARCMLFTSTWEEPYGLAIAESLACGTPVVAFQKGAAPEILTEQTGVLVENQTMEDLIGGIEQAVELDRRECRWRAEKFCSIEKMVSSYLNLYAQLRYPKWPHYSLDDDWILRT